MNKTLRITNITQTDQRGTVQFTEFDESKKPLANVVIVFPTAEEAAAYKHGKDYIIDIKPVD